MPRGLAYVGSRTTRERNARGCGISVCEVGESGAWRLIQQVTGLRNPSYLCLHPALPLLYAVHGDFSEVSSFHIAGDGRITQTGEQSTAGRNPVHLAVSPSGQWLLLANYASGNVVSLRIGEGGALGAVACSLPLPGACGPRAEQAGPHPHQICFDPTGRWALVPDKGLDQVFALGLTESTGYLHVGGATSFPAGCGPRHMVFADAGLAYVVGELDRTVMACRYAAESGQLSISSRHATVPTNVASGSAAGILLTPGGNTLAVSNRGHDSVALFHRSPTGELAPPTWVRTGRTPRFIGCGPDGDHLVVANEDDDTVATVLLGRDLPPSCTPVAHTGSPVCVIFRKS